MAKTTVEQREVLKNLRAIYDRSDSYNEYRNEVIEYARTQQLIPAEEVFGLAALVSPIK